MNESELLVKLSEPFAPSEVEWKPGALSADGLRALALAYADPRVYMTRLDLVCGVDWSVTYTPWGDGRIICHLTIEGRTRSSTGEADAQSERSEIAGTAAEAQAFKRACAMWGLGRYLYNLPVVWAEYDPKRRTFTDEGRARLAESLRRPPVVSHRNGVPSAAVIERVEIDMKTLPEMNPAGNGRDIDAEWRAIPGASQTGKQTSVASPTTDEMREEVKKWREMDDVSALCSEAQYRFLVGTVKNICRLPKDDEQAHHVILRGMFGREVDSEHLPGRAATRYLLDVLPENTKNRDSGEWTPNLRRNLIAVAAVIKLAQATTPA